MTPALKSTPKAAALPSPVFVQYRHLTPLDSPSPTLTVIETLPTPTTPPWLIGLRKLRLPVTILTGLLVVGTLPVYGWIAVTQQRWGVAYRELETLQRQERQLTSDRAIQRFRVVEESEQRAALIPQGPANTIFIPPARLRPSTAQKPVEVSKPAVVSPVSY